MMVCVGVMLVVLSVRSGTCHRLFVLSCHPCTMISLLYSTSQPCCVNRTVQPASVNSHTMSSLLIILGVCVLSLQCQGDYGG